VDILLANNPAAFYMVEDVKQVNEGYIGGGRKTSFFRRWGCLKIFDSNFYDFEKPIFLLF